MNKMSLIVLAACLPFTASAQLFISEYVEGGSYNKAIELYNPSNSDIDLSNYKIKLYQNGSDSANYTITLTGAIEANSTFVIAHSNIDSSVSTNFTVNNLLHNGDDAIVLTEGDVVIDSIGQVGQDPGSQWGTDLTSTKDNTLVRISTISTGDTDTSDIFDPSAEWQGFAKDTLANLGSHTFSGETIDDNNPGDSDDNEGEGDDNNSDSLAECGMSYTPIYTIQGSTDISPLLNETVWTEGIVVANFQTSGYKGFFIQSADNEVDALNTSSEGIFVYHDADPVQVGDRIRLNATIGEYYEQTQLSTVNTLIVCTSENTLPTAASLTLPVDSINDLEAYEGMLVNFKQALYVTDTYNYGRYGQLGLASERLFNPTQIATPGDDATSVAANNLHKSIILDDGDTSQNPESLPFPATELTALNTVRSGDSINNLTAVLTYSYGDYQLIPTEVVNVTATNPRTTAPELSATANLRVASFNVLNYFNGDGTGEGFPTARGADNEEEFTRQRAKVIAALVELNADIIGLMEIENDGYGELSAISDLVNGLNAVLGDDVYQYITPETSTIGTDEIAVGILYRQDKVSPQGEAKILDSSNSASDEEGEVLFLDTSNRPMLAQAFTLISSEESLVVAVNHLKSKGSDCDHLGDYDTNDGQGNCNLTRTRAAQAIGKFLTSTYPDQASLVIGDLNAYAKEDPVTTLATQGYADIFAEFERTKAYSYIYSGELGQLDHALANDKLMNQVVAINTWSINADEPRTLDYNTEYQSTEQQSKFYSPDAYRSSDHDPVIIDFNLVPESLLGDFDNDGDIDKNDITAFYQQIQSGQLADLSYDFNSDGTVSSRDVRSLMALCTRSRCATE